MWEMWNQLHIVSTISIAWIHSNADFKMFMLELYSIRVIDGKLSKASLCLTRTHWFIEKLLLY